MKAGKDELREKNPSVFHKGVTQRHEYKFTRTAEYQMKKKDT